MHSLLLALTTAIAIFYGLPSLQLLRLLKQGSACFKHCSKACLMRSALQPFYTTDVWELHWFPLKQRIHFKILLFAFKAIHGVAPTYIQNLVSLKSQGTYNLSSSGGILLASSTFRSKVTLSDRSFQVAALLRVSFAISQTCILLRAILRRIFLSLLMVEWISIVTYRYLRFLWRKCIYFYCFAYCK